jgi:hypothetical protein
MNTHWWRRLPELGTDRGLSSRMAHLRGTPAASQFQLGLSGPERSTKLQQKLKAEYIDKHSEYTRLSSAAPSLQNP